MWTVRQQQYIDQNREKVHRSSRSSIAQLLAALSVPTMAARARSSQLFDPQHRLANSLANSSARKSGSSPRSLRVCEAATRRSEPTPQPHPPPTASRTKAQPRAPRASQRTKSVSSLSSIRNLPPPTPCTHPPNPCVRFPACATWVHSDPSGNDRTVRP